MVVDCVVVAVVVVVVVDAGETPFRMFIDVDVDVDVVDEGRRRGGGEDIHTHTSTSRVSSPCFLHEKKNPTKCFLLPLVYAGHRSPVSSQSSPLAYENWKRIHSRHTGKADTQRTHSSSFSLSLLMRR